MRSATGAGLRTAALRDHVAVDSAGVCCSGGVAGTTNTLQVLMVRLPGFRFGASSSLHRFY